MKKEQQGGSTARIRTICPLINCPSYDGIVATVQNGKVTRIEGDKEHPMNRGYACAKACHEWETMYHPHRFKQPLLKTASGWKGISWEEAIEVAAERLGEVRAKFGPLSFCGSHAIIALPEGLALMLLLRSLGSPNEIINTDLCMGTAEIADAVTYGDTFSIYHSAQDFRNSKCVLLVGTNMEQSCGGQWQDVLFAKGNGAKLIVIDPRRCESAKQADMYLQIRPGTDGALALGMIHVIINENLYDADFVNNYCHGFDKLREHVQQYTPQRVAEITSLSPEEIVQVARTYATNGPASYRGNIGVSLHSNSTQTARAFDILVAITGNVDVPGGNRLTDPGPAGLSGPVCNCSEELELLKSTCLPREVEEQTLGAGRFPLWCGPDSIMRKAHVPSVINAIITGDPYPVKAMIVQNVNPVLSYPDTRKTIEALKKLEFLMVIAYTPTPTSEFADLILPAVHPFEQNDVRLSVYGSWLSAMPKLVEPPEGCFDGVRILYQVSERMAQKGYIQKNLIPWKNSGELLERKLSNTGFSYKELCEKGPITVERQYRKYVKSGFQTPSGKVELYSTRLERYGYEPLPVFKECAESPLLLPGLAARYPLMLTTRRGKEYYVTRSAAYGWVRKLTPYPKLQIHPGAAQKRGIQQGDMVIVETPRGSFQHQAELIKDIHPQVVNAAWGWWLPEKEALEKGSLETNVSAALSYDPPHDPEVGINRTQGALCEVCRAGK